MKNYKVIGLMSGTSLDGLDLAYCHLQSRGNSWEYEIVETKSVAYEAKMQLQLRDAIYLSAPELLLFHNTYGSWLGKQVRQFTEEAGLTVDFIASHGHTTHHQPQQGLTWQIGSGQHLANASGCTTVCDFRTNDVALGGQGAPLVPIGDQMLFAEYDFCLNLGGISNVSFDQNGQRKAYDIGLANMILNHITRKIELPYDKGGEMAARGKINRNMLNQLNALEYYSLPWPKSTGYEWFVEKVVPIIEHTDDSTENLLHTAVHHICEQVTVQLKLHISSDNHSLLVSGGGAHNQFLIYTLQQLLGKRVQVVIPSPLITEFKEALVFALMGVLRIENKINVLSSVTGASKDSSSGVVYLPA